MASISKVSATELRTPQLRFDSEYFLPDRIRAAALVDSFPRKVRLSFLCDKITQGSNPSFSESGLPCLNGRNIRFGSASMGVPNYISETEFRRLHSYRLQKDDIVITLKHATKIGRSWIIEDDSPRIFARNVGLIRLRPGAPLSPPSLLFYLWSDVGQKLLDRFATGGTTGQITLAMSYLKRIWVPLFRETDQRGLSGFFDAYQATIARSNELYTSAERTLGEELGLDRFDLSHRVGYEARLSETFRARRWDGEFYKPKYQRMIDAVARARKVRVGGFAPVGRLVSYLTNGHTPLHHDLSVGDVLFLTAEHVSDFGIDFGTEKRILLRHHETELARTALRDGDILVTIKGKVGNCAVVRSCPDSANINQDVALVRLRKEIHPYFFAAWFNSPMGKQLTEQRSTGGINPFVGLGNLRQMPFPVIDPKEHWRIGGLVQEIVEKAYAAAREASGLLEKAKRRVEELIEREARR